MKVKNRNIQSINKPFLNEVEYDMKKCADQGLCNTPRRVIFLRNQAMVSSHVHKPFRQFLMFRTAERAIKENVL